MNVTFFGKGHSNHTDWCITSALALLHSIHRGFILWNVMAATVHHCAPFSIQKQWITVVIYLPLKSLASILLVEPLGESCFLYIYAVFYFLTQPQTSWYIHTPSETQCRDPQNSLTLHTATHRHKCSVLKTQQSACHAFSQIWLPSWCHNNWRADFTRSC